MVELNEGEKASVKICNMLKRKNSVNSCVKVENHHHFSEISSQNQNNQLVQNISFDNWKTLGFYQHKINKKQRDVLLKKKKQIGFFYET